MKKIITGKSSITAIFAVIIFTVFSSTICVTAQNNLDLTYNAGVTESYNSVFATAVQTDGKILVGGLFDGVNGSDRGYLERFNIDGTRDLSFNEGNTGLDGNVYYIALQADGKIIVGGLFSQYNGVNVTRNLIRLNFDGSLDTTFNSGGTSANSLSLKIVVQPDGKILIGGFFTQYNGVSRNRIARLNSDGTLDTSFDPGTGTNSSVYEIALQSDGKIIIGGFFSTFNGVSRNAYARLNSDGSIDATFNIGTGATLDNQTTVGQVLGIAVQASGKIIIGGAFSFINNVGTRGIARLNSDGTLDTSFARTGGDYIDHIVIQSDGKILIGGIVDFPNSYAVLRLNEGGSVDTSFQPTAANAVNHISIQSDGKLLIGGNFTYWGNTERRNLVRVASNGVLDTTFNIELTRVGIVNEMIQQADGKTIVAGDLLLANGVRRSNIARFNPDGSLDMTFNPVATPSYQSIQAVAVQSNGKILIGGTFTQTDDGTTSLNRLARLNANGSLDTSFTNNIPTSQVSSIKALSNGKILVGGFFSVNSAIRGLIRINSDGTLDETFNTGTGANSTVRDIEIQPDGKILIAGNFSQYNSVNRGRIARLNADGSLDTSFANGAGANSTISDLVLQTDGKIIGGGGFSTFDGVNRRQIARFNSDGSLDATFDIGTGVGGFIYSVVVQPSGKIFIGNSNPNNPLARLNNSGSLDTTFVSGFAPSSATQYVSDILQLADGKVLVGGVFKTYQGVNKNSLLRLYAPEIGGGTQPILFNTNRDGNYEIYKMNADGSNQQRLTNTPEGEGGGQWSPDGQKILYFKLINSTTQIWVMNADGTNQTQLSEANGSDSLYKWSPNGQKIVFVRRETGGTDQIWTMNADGSNKTRLTNTTTNDHFPDWSPDGSKIAFGRCNANYVCDIFTMNADGSNQVNITPNSVEDDEDNPQWSKDGSKIIFGFVDIDASGENLISSNVFIMNADGTNRQSLTDGTATSSFAYRLGSGVYPISPNGNKIALAHLNRVFTTSNEYRNSFEISSIGIDGGNLVNLTNNSVYDEFGAWSPDSSKIAFESRRDAATGEIYTMNADGTGVIRLTFNTAADSVTDWYRPQTTTRHTPFDFDGDGKSDYAVFRPSNGIWYQLNSTSGYTGSQFGLSTDRLSPADYDGDGKTDVAVFRSGTWYLLQSKDGFKQTQFGQAGDVSVPADFDGDGKADLAVYRDGANGGQSFFYYLGTLNNPNKNITFLPFGSGGDKPVVGDYDGDGKSDPGVYRNGVWYLLRSQAGATAVQFGIASDKATPADFDGDGKVDLAVYRNGVWYVLQSSDSQVKITQFGLADDKPTVGDYDGDGKADLSVWRASNGVFYVLGSQTGFTAVQFGTNGDVPVASAYVP